MVKCKTDCVERPLSLGFGKLGHFIGRNPWVFLILPLVVSAGLGAGFYFLEERESNSIEGEFTPKNGPAKTERAYIQENFPEGDEFFSLRMSTDGASASVILLNYSNILTNESFQEISYLDRYIREIKADESTLTYEDICARRSGECVFNHILDYVNVSLSSGRPITYPINEGEFVATAIGGVSLNTGKIETAIAIRLFYYLREDIKNETDLWLKKFIKTLPQHKTLETVTVSYFTSISREEEFDSNSKTVIPLFSITYFLAITVSIISCLRLDCVRNKVWVATFGVLAAGLAVLTSFGLLLLCGMPFVMTVATAPFLILGIGVDDMFIMISCWQRTKVHDSVEDRMAETYKEAAVSITITTLTDVLAFYIGLLTPFGSVQSFCMYTGTAILFCYIYNITFFGAFLALNGRREQSNRHWLTCMKVETPEESRRSNPCCVGGAFDAETKAEEEMPINVFFKKYYGPVLINPWTKLFVIVLYAGYLSGSIYGCFQIQEGIDLKNLAPDDSYVASYYDNEKYYFREYGPFVMLIIRNEDFQYWNSTARQEILDKCLERFKSSEFVVQDVSWIKSYLIYGAINGINLTDENVFMSRLPTFLNGSEFKHDVKFSNDKIVASRIFLSTANISTAVDEKKMLKFFRSTATECGKDLNMLVYHPAFIYYDQYAVIVSNTVQNVLFATAVMLVISLLLIPNPLCSLWVTFAIASVIVGVAGFMALWDVNLDSISMINLVICIGFSVDFSAHISYAFVSSEKKSANEKAIDAIYNLGYPITQGAISTIAGVVVLAAAKSYIFRTFFKIMFLVIIFGALHGVVFIPIFLTFFGCCSSGTIEDENKENVRTSESCNSQRLSIPGKHPTNGAYTHKHGHANLAMDPSSP